MEKGGARPEQALHTKFPNPVNHANAHPLRDTASPPPEKQKLKSLIKAGLDKIVDPHELTDTASEDEVQSTALEVGLARLSLCNPHTICEPVICTLGTHFRAILARVHGKTCLSMCLVTVGICKSRRQPPNPIGWASQVYARFLPSAETEGTAVMHISFDETSKTRFSKRNESTNHLGPRTHRVGQK